MDEFNWAEPYPEVYKICKLFQLHDVQKPVEFKYKSLPQFSQQGPQCGIVALALLVGNPKKNVEKIYMTAKESGFTCNGEMFSVTDMVKLAQIHLPEGSTVKSYCGILDTENIRNFLLDDGLLLVPYDTSKDNSPGLYKGHKAHWAAVAGAILTEDDFFVIARHGKAINVAIWPLKQLAQSNCQLLEFSPDRELHEYKLPEGGIAGVMGLNSQCVLIKLP